MYERRLRELIKSRGITIKELCNSIGVSEGGFYQSIKNKSFKISTFEEISKILDVPMSYWFNESPPKRLGFSGNDKFQLQTIQFLQEKVIDLNSQLRLIEKLVEVNEEKITRLEKETVKIK